MFFFSDSREIHSGSHKLDIGAVFHCCGSARAPLVPVRCKTPYPIADKIAYKLSRVFVCAALDP